MSVSKEQAEQMVDKYVKEIGLSKENTYDAQKKAWYWVKGAARIEVFIQEIKFDSHSRFYLRVFSPITSIPEQNKMEFFQYLLEMNDSKLGVKMSLFPGTDQIYACYERDIKGMEYEELATCIGDVEWWSNQIKVELHKKYKPQH